MIKDLKSYNAVIKTLDNGLKTSDDCWNIFFKHQLTEKSNIKIGSFPITGGQGVPIWKFDCKSILRKRGVVKFLRKSDNNIRTLTKCANA